VDTYYFRQINLPFGRKTELAANLLRYISKQPGAVPRVNPSFQQFLDETGDRAGSQDPRMVEYVARIFWVCCELGLLRYQYPYPQRGQTYRLTRAGCALGKAPHAVVAIFVALAYVVAVVAAPVRYFNKIRNVVTALTGLFLWWRQQEMTAWLIATSISAGIVSTWIASFFTRDD
jgi:hypothetical protein